VVIHCLLKCSSVEDFIGKTAVNIVSKKE